ncbi:GIY-YIG nuclease family protein, partial [Leptospira sp. SA-E8]|uniref:GIY-YIG nuclease family protein n=1 Tax=Leptospira sp. SA-E8 TaxID=3422259 RepID=UPI003EBCE532
PFVFDVHERIGSEDAPGLENLLHRQFVRTQINKVNPRKEFFRVGITEIKGVIESKGIEASWTVAAQAAEYRESLAIEKRLTENPELAQDWIRSQEESVPVLDLSPDSSEV